MSRSASAAPRSPATVVKRANISVFLPTDSKIFARVYLVMSLVTVKVPKAPEPLACMRRSGITSRTNWPSFSCSQTSCDSSGPRGPAVRLFWLSGTGAPNWVVRWVTGHFFSSDGLLMLALPVIGPATLARRNDKVNSIVGNKPIARGYRPEDAASALAAEQAAADLQQVADAELAVTTPVEHGSKQVASAAFLADLLLVLAEQGPERLRAGVALLGGLAGEEGHHERGEDLQQLAGLVGVQPRDLGYPGLRARLAAAEDVAEDACAVGLAPATAA